LLHALELPELITSNLEEYEQTALRLTKDPERLRELRARLHAARESTGVFDGARFARKLESAFAKMWEIYSSGEPPRAFRIG
jgi:predicted O-linked N-acetylglucosamine transferase (SPINDLY family)